MNLKDETVNKIISYLASRPFKEVAQLIGILQEELNKASNVKSDKKKK